MSVKWFRLEVGPIIGLILTALAMAASLGSPASAQISMQRPGITGLPPAKKQAAPAQSATTLTPDEQKRLSGLIHHMKPQDRKKLAKALQKMTPQQRQQLLASVKQQLAQVKKASR
jgi:hypothetical protein